MHYIDFFIRLGLYPLTCLIFMNLFPVHRSRSTKVCFLIFSSLLLTLIEWGMHGVSIIKYDGWKLQYSFFKYLFIFLLVYINGFVSSKLSKGNSME
ncbi:hypothetical protein D3H55_22655 [Bacillus salacetis]|uniref:Uncharacterized protein n=1 Tax=Bacillus salacetis TaxID=2315464 RepID=A0A3A1QSM2_9BACI|nr:hypothetical protein D3H55_22655 [Bacillus salacetis]